MNEKLDPTVEIRPATVPEMDRVRGLFMEYAASLGFSLCFQGFDRELATLPGDYGVPGGALLLGWSGDGAVGCVGLRPLEAQIGEIKRLYVQPAHRGTGLGRGLALRVIELARHCGHQRLRLDTLSTMQAAIALYESLGFYEIPPYRPNPIEGARFFELMITEPGFLHAGGLPRSGG